MTKVYDMLMSLRRLSTGSKRRRYEGIIRNLWDRRDDEWARKQLVVTVGKLRALDDTVEKKP